VYLIRSFIVRQACVFSGSFLEQQSGGGCAIINKADLVISWAIISCAVQRPRIFFTKAFLDSGFVILNACVIVKCSYANWLQDTERHMWLFSRISLPWLHLRRVL
jgi:hypothetical protein